MLTNEQPEENQEYQSLPSIFPDIQSRKELDEWLDSIPYSPASWMSEEEVDNLSEQFNKEKNV